MWLPVTLQAGNGQLEASRPLPCSWNVHSVPYSHSGSRFEGWRQPWESNELLGSCGLNMWHTFLGFWWAVTVISSCSWKDKPCKKVPSLVNPVTYWSGVACLFIFLCLLCIGANFWFHLGSSRVFKEIQKLKSTNTVLTKIWHSYINCEIKIGTAIFNRSLDTFITIKAHI